MSTEGIKYDTDKPRVAEMVIDFGDAMLELSKVWSFGADKYDKSNWKFVENGKDRYTNALLRHLIAEGTNQYDDESRMLHATHVAWNALARLWFILREPIGVDFDTYKWSEILLNSDEDKMEIDRRCNEMINKHFEDNKKERLD